MAELFSEQWMQKYLNEWNKEATLAKDLSNIGFNSTIAYGFDHEDDPRGVMVIEKGQAVCASVFDNQTPNWDLRASKENWQIWFKHPPGMMALGMAYTTYKLKFNKGDYTALLKDPHIAAPFIKSFDVMGRV